MRTLVTTYMSVFERTDHCRLIDDLSSGSIHDERALLELPDHLLIDHTFCILSERNVHAKDIRLREHLIELVRCEVLAPVGSERVLAARVVDDAHGEGVCKLSEAQPDTTETEDGKRTSGKVVGVSGLVSRFPLSCAEVLLGVREVAECGDHEVESGGRSRVVDCSWRVRHDDS